MSIQSHDVREHRASADPSRSRSATIPAKKARQDGIGRPVLVVLIVGLILAALAWWGAEIYGTSIDTRHVIEQPAQQTPPSGG